MKKFDLFVIAARNRECRYLLERPHRGGSNGTHNLCFIAEIRKIMYTPASPIFYIKVGFEGGKII